VEIKIQVTNGWRLPKKVSAEAVRKGLLWIENKKRSRISEDHPDGWITNEEIIAEGREPGSDVFPLFEHATEAIVERYLHDQANYLAGCYKASVIYDDGTTVVMNPANVIVGPIGGERIHVSTAAAAKMEDNGAQAIGEAIDFLKAAQNRLARIQTTFRLSARIIEAIGLLIAQIEKSAMQKQRRKQVVPRELRP
jgi:hypothetical protein